MGDDGRPNSQQHLQHLFRDRTLHNSWEHGQARRAAHARMQPAHGADLLSQKMPGCRRWMWPPRVM